MILSYTNEDMSRTSRTGGGPLQAIKNEINESVLGRRPKIFFFSDAENPHEAECYGQKGVSLNQLQQMKLPVPEGFTITVEAAGQLFNNAPNPEGQNITDRYLAAMRELERRTGRKFGGMSTNLNENIVAAGNPLARSIITKDEIPLLVSIRASSQHDVPGAARSILNVGLTESLTQKLAEKSFNPQWVYDSYRRLLQMFGTVVFGVEERKYRMIVKNTMLRAGIFSESTLTVPDLLQIITEFKRLATVPDDPFEQLALALNGIYRSWYSGTAEKFKLAYGIDQRAGVALVVQSMVFGNLNNRCGVGFAFSRHPNTGKSEYIAEYVKCAIGADVLAGSFHVKDIIGLREDNPGLFYNLVHSLKLLERYYKDMIEIEFTVENGVFYLLNCIPANRSARAAVSLAVQMVREGLITEREAVSRIDPVHMIHYLKPQLPAVYQYPNDLQGIANILTKGIASSFGIVYGKVVMSPTDVSLCKERNIPCIFCLPEITADDIAAVESCAGIITTKGGLASHVSTWLREVGKPGVIGARDLVIDPMSRHLVAMDTGMRIAEGEYVTIDGFSGYVFAGKVESVNCQPDEDYYSIMAWAKAFRKQRILATIESEEEAVEAIQFGADGIGLLKTESLFYGHEYIDLSRFILLSKSESERAAALATMQEMQRSDLLRVFRAIGDRDIIVVRLLNVSSSNALKSLKLPESFDSLSLLSSKLNIPSQDIFQTIDTISEPNPALGIRGCREALLQTQWTVMQVRAITAATVIARSEGLDIQTKILLPTAFTSTEIDRLLPLVKEAIAETCAQLVLVPDFKESSLKFEIGVSISVPRACIVADKLTRNPDISFISVDTDELTQLVYGVDQYRNETIMNSYEERHVIPNNPFAVLDVEGVGLLINTAIMKARSKNNSKIESADKVSGKSGKENLQVNIYGVHSSESDSIRFFEEIGVDTLTVPKTQWIPAAALAAAQAVIDPTKKYSKRPFRPFGFAGSSV